MAGELAEDAREEAREEAFNPVAGFVENARLRLRLGNFEQTAFFILLSPLESAVCSVQQVSEKPPCQGTLEATTFAVETLYECNPVFLKYVVSKQPVEDGERTNQESESQHLHPL